MDIVIDTNVLVAALRSRKGASFALLDQLSQGLYTPAISVPLFVEYESVLKRPGIAPITANDIDTLLNFMLNKAQITEIYYLWRPWLKDPKDDLVLEVAIASSSTYIVTFNTKDFKGIEHFNCRTITPKDYLLQRGITP